MAKKKPKGLWADMLKISDMGLKVSDENIKAFKLKKKLYKK